MTVEYIPIVHRYSYTGLGNYTFDFYLTNENYLKVTYEDTGGNITELSKDIDYLVVVNSEATPGGYAEILVSPGTDGILILQRDVPITQETEWSVEGHLNLPRLETSLDEVVMMIQQIDSFINTEFFNALRFRGDWAANTLYDTLNIVVESNNFYLAKEDFTSGATFDVDNWSLILDFTDLYTAVSTATTAASEASDSADAAALDAATAATSAGSALSSEANAGISEANSAVNAQNAANCRQEAYDQSQLAAAQVTLAEAQVTLAETAKDGAEAAQTAAEAAAASIVPVPAGGLTDEVLKKASDTDYDLTWGEGGGGGGLDWSTAAQSVDFTAEDAKGYPVDTSSNSVTVTLPAGTAGMTIAIKDYAQTFGLFSCLLAPNGTEKIEGSEDTLVVDTRGAYVTLVYTDATKGWLAVSASAQNPVINKPYMHVQDQKPTGTSGGASVVGDNDRELNTVMTNEISGATLSANEVTLPAGKYLLKAKATISADVSFSGRTYIRKSEGTVLAVSPLIAGNGSNDGAPGCSVEVTFTESTAIKVTSYNSDAASYGLGQASSQAPYEVYTDLMIWKLDSDIEAPYVYQPVNQPVVGVEVTGGIFGGELVYNDATNVDINPISCMDDTLQQEIVISTTSVVNIPTPAINTIYNLFAVRYDGGTYGIEYDTDVNGANLVATVTHKRWIGYVLTNSSGGIIPFVMAEGVLSFADFAATLIGTITSTSFTLIDLSAFLPTGRVSHMDFICAASCSVNASTAYFSLNGSTDFARICNGSTSTNATNTGETYPRVPYTVGSTYFKRATGNVPTSLKSIWLIR